MYKQVITIVIISILIFSLNKITQDYTDKTVETIREDLESIRQDIMTGNFNNEDLKQNINKTYEKWEELDDKLAFYIEHNEIEKIKSSLISVRSYIEVQEYSQAIENIDKSIYVLEYIDEKEKISLDNIF
ncbi:MAG: DUF4363 family protein [Clostridia bacterium]|jgi:uncharacterized membrane protein YgaE (UPF0421/DUF939 family)|nr:DUF4363 family protein [Clostridia bacterium]